MRRLIALAMTATLLLTTAGVATAHDGSNGRALAKGEIFRVNVTRNVVQGGRVGITATIWRCDRSTLKDVTITATTDLTGGTVTLKRVGMIQNPRSRAKACVWKAAFRISPTATLGDHAVSISAVHPVRDRSTGVVSTASAMRTMTIRVKAPDASSGTDRTSGS